MRFDQELLDLLAWMRANVPPTWQQQAIFGDRTKKALAWLPGGSVDKPWMLEGADPERIGRIMDEAEMFGATPGFYLDPTKHQHEQAVMIAWVGLDIDIETGRQRDKVWASLDAECAKYLVRSSNSGLGIHMFRRLYSPIWTQPRNRNHVVSRITRRLIETLPEPVAAAVCSSDYRAFWIAGGLQTTFHTPDRASDLWITGEWLEEVVMPTVVEKVEVDTEGMDERIAEIVKVLAAAGIKADPGRRVQIVVRRAFEALKGTAWEFQTKSKMRAGETACNGFVECSNQSLTIFSSPDNRAVVRVKGLEYFKAMAGA